MKINWTVRLKNKVWLASFVSFIVATVYTLLNYFDIVPAIPQENVMNIVATILQLLSLMGIIVDPTTKGLGDSERALGYKVPN